MFLWMLKIWLVLFFVLFFCWFGFLCEDIKKGVLWSDLCFELMSIYWIFYEFVKIHKREWVCLDYSEKIDWIDEGNGVFSLKQ